MKRNKAFTKSLLKLILLLLLKYMYLINYAIIIKKNHLIYIYIYTRLYSLQQHSFLPRENIFL